MRRVMVGGLVALSLMLATAAWAAPAQPKAAPQQPALTAEDKAVLTQAKDLQKQLKIARLELALAEAKELPEREIAPRAEETYRLQGQLHALRVKHQDLFWKLASQRERPDMGPGMGQGRGGRGHGMGPGMGQGRGGRGSGMGPGMGQGRGGRGSGMGPGMGQGRGGRGHGMGPGMGQGRGGMGLRWQQPPAVKDEKTTPSDQQAIDGDLPVPPPPPAE